MPPLLVGKGRNDSGIKSEASGDIQAVAWVSTPMQKESESKVTVCRCCDSAGHTCAYVLLLIGILSEDAKSLC